MNSVLLQQKLFEQIRAKWGNKKNLTKELMGLLGLGQNAIYKRTSGNMLLNFKELTLIARHYDISLDQVFHSPGQFTSFQFNALCQKPPDLESYLATINTDIVRLSSVYEPSIHYVSNDLPVFYYFLSPELLAFKLFVWGRTIWEWPGFQQKKFGLQKMFKDYPILRQESVALSAYLDIESTEFWKTSILNHILGQIDYCHINGMFFQSNDALVLCEQLHILIKKIQAAALKENKAPLKQKTEEPNKKEKNFHLFQDEVNNTNNIILVQSAEVNAVYTTFDSPNFMVSVDPLQLAYTKKSFRRIQKRSHLISGSESRGLLFFKTLEKKIRQTKRLIQKRNTLSSPTKPTNHSPSTNTKPHAE